MSMHMEGPWLSTTGKKKGKKQHRTAKHANTARAQANAWEELLKKYEVKPNVHTKPKSILTPRDDWKDRVPASRRTDHLRSLDTGSGIAVKKDIPQYTGDAMIGIGQLHKSNGVPIFSKEDAVDISKMRRG